MLDIGKFLAVDAVPSARGAKTLRWALLNRGGSRLGVISWYSPWRCYTVDPEPGTTFNSQCLRDIARFLDSVRSKRVQAEGGGGG